MNILLATHGRPELLQQTLSSLLASVECAQKSVMQIVVVENGGDSGARSVIESVDQHKQIRLLSVPEGNKSNALNIALQYCSEGLIFMTDDDVIVNPQTVLAYQRAANVNGPGHFFGGPICTVSEEGPAPWLEPFVPLSVKGLSLSESTFRGQSRFLGANWAAYSGDLLAAGGFNPNFGPGSHTGATGQEKEMQLRLQANGGRGIWVEAALVTHVVPVERSSPEWILKRNFRTAVQQGILEAMDDIGKARSFLRRRRCRAKLRGFVAAILGGELRRFRHQYRCEWETGYSRGVEFVSKGNLIPPPFFSPV